MNKGKKVKFDIGSTSFEKRKKKRNSIRLRKLSESHKKTPTDRNATDMS